MKIGGLNKLTTQDFPGNLACIIFTSGCNFNCDYCYNRDLVESNTTDISLDEVFSYLEERKNMLDGVVISGGEPTIWNDLIPFIERIKEYGFKIKLDTNGYKPEVLKEIIDKNLVDYIAMDIKAVFNNYYKIINKKIDTNKIIESIKLINESKIDHEFRTTIIKGMHTKEDLDEIVKLVNGSPYYLQNFKMEDTVINKKMEGFTEDELNDLKNHFKNKPNVTVRYI
ncbi:MAG: anaerobic ribonucleoside-triphosphate reductase activating protein [Bacilli bacterium]|nr:anaerobic ribonucleoside-triphosphate reductase activating protein [Bacilli bacterium]